ncbi:MAG: dipeptidase [Clostridia bacterium]|nr:dipeptidase [Clostridia bacterium]
MIFDLHCDTIWQIWKSKRTNQPLDLRQSCLQIDEEKLQKGGYFAQCFAAYVPADTSEPEKAFDEIIDAYYEGIDNSDCLRPVYAYEDFEKNAKAGKISALLTMEDATPLRKELANVQKAYDKGVRMIGLTWNFPNAVGYPNYRDFVRGEKPDMLTPETEKGLTEFGFSLVEEMNRLGIVADVSHLSDKGFFDVLKTSKRPIMASHSNARAVCRNVRNMTDEMLSLLAKNGGVVGMNYAKGFLCEDEEKGKRTIEYVIKHVKHIKKLIGVEHIALGSDFDGISTDIELCNASKLPLLLQAFERAGFSDGEIEKIAYRNALRVFKENMGK